MILARYSPFSSSLMYCFYMGNVAIYTIFALVLDAFNMLIGPFIVQSAVFLSTCICNGFFLSALNDFTLNALCDLCLCGSLIFTYRISKHQNRADRLCVLCRLLIKIGQGRHLLSLMRFSSLSIGFLLV